MKSLNLTAALAVEAAATGRRFKIFAYAGGKLTVDGIDIPVVVDLQTLRARPGFSVIIDHDARTDHTLGQVDQLTNDGRGLTIAGPITGDHQPAVRNVLAQAAKGHVWEASIGAQYDISKAEIVPPGESKDINGQTLAGPFLLARYALLRETSVLPMGADPATSVNLAARAATTTKGTDMKTFEEFCAALGVDLAGASDTLKAVLQAQYDQENQIAATATEGMTEAATEEETAVAAAASLNLQAAGNVAAAGQTAAAAGLVDPVAAERQRIATEYSRIATIQARCANNPAVLQAAIRNGWDADRAELEMLRQATRGQAPAGHVHSHDATCTLQALQGAMILRAGGRLDHPAYRGRSAYAGNVPAWLRAGINDAQRNQIMEASHQFSDMSLVDLAREALRLDRQEVPRNRSEMIRAAFSGASLTNIFTTNINTQILATYEEFGDQTREWTQETEVADFKTNERPRMEKGPSLAKLPRTGTADDYTRSDVGESFKIARYAKKMQIDEQDIIDDSFNALADMPVEMGNAAARLRPDLVYALLLANPTLTATARSLFNATDGNLDTSAALATATLKAASSAMFLFQEQGVNLGLNATHLLVPPTLEYTAMELLQSPTIVIAGTAGSVTERGSMNTLAKKSIKVIADPRLENGVIDPDSGTTYSGSTSTWYLACAMAHTIIVAFLRGTGRSPQVRKFNLERGQWGIGWDINMDIGVKAMDWKGLHKATA